MVECSTQVEPERRPREMNMDRSKLPRRFEEWQGKQISCRLMDGKHEVGHWTEAGDGWLILMRPNGREIILFTHAIISIEERPRTNE
jgi:hypothetical protein